MNNNVHEENIALFVEALSALQNVTDVRKLLDDICTPQEIKTIAQRLAVARLLGKEMVYADISKITGASTATISRVRRSMEQSRGGYSAAGIM